MHPTQKTPLTVAQAVHEGLVEVLIFSPPNEMLDSQYGGLRYDRYLGFELARITANGDRRAAIVKNSNGDVALFADNVAETN